MKILENAAKKSLGEYGFLSTWRKGPQFPKPSRINKKNGGTGCYSTKSWIESLPPHDSRVPNLTSWMGTFEMYLDGFILISVITWLAVVTKK